MSRPRVTKDGAVISAALDYKPNTNAAQRLFNGFAILAGQVVGIYPKDSPQNSGSGNKGWVTYYDVLVTLPSQEQEVIRKCVHMQSAFGGGPNNFFEVVQPNPGYNAQQPTQQSSLKEGHMVIVALANGRRDSGVILGGIPHPAPRAANARPTVKEGAVTRGEIQGLFFEVNNDGELQVAFNGPRNAKGELTSKNGPTKLLLDKTGAVRITTKDGQSVVIDRAGKKITLASKSGDSQQLALDGTKDTVTLTNKSGQSLAMDAKAKTVSVKSGSTEITINPSGGIDIKASAAVKVSAPNVEIGDGGQPMVLGSALTGLLGAILGLLVTLAGPIPVAPLQAQLQTILSKKNKNS